MASPGSGPRRCWQRPVHLEVRTAQEADKRHRVDLRDLAFVTIDGEDARDFDDAVYCEKRRGAAGACGWRSPTCPTTCARASALDEEAANRGNSVYFPERVVPMLPEALSNGLCSLVPAVDRLAMVCEMELSRVGNLTRYHFYEAVIHSHARLTYTQVGEVLEKGRHPEVDKRLVPDLKRGCTASTKCCARRANKRGAIDFETVETRIIFDEQRKIDAIVPVVRNDAHKLIEECMLCANVAAARLFEEPTDCRFCTGCTRGPRKRSWRTCAASSANWAWTWRVVTKPTPIALPAVAAAGGGS